MAKHILLLALVLLSITADRFAQTTKPAFDYYGWFYVIYDQNDNDFDEIASYTNTAFAVIPEQVELLKAHHFEHIVYVFNEAAILDLLWQHEGRDMPAPDIFGVVWHEQYIPDFKEKFFAAYRQYMAVLKASLIAADVYEAIEIFHLADEPALHTNVYLDQDFLDEYVEVFRETFPDKKSSIAFAENWQAGTSPYPGTGRHYNPPEYLDIVIVSPYFYAAGSGEPQVPCEREAIQEWLYEGSPASNINWAQQFDKPIIVVGDARIQDNLPPPDCHVIETYNILQEDTNVTGLIWFIYDKGYEEAGAIRGAANDPELIDLIRGLAE